MRMSRSPRLLTAVLITILITGTLVLGGCRSGLGTVAETTPATLKKLTLEELMNVEVTSVARTATRLSETPAAVEVITREDIRRSGATTLAEALRLAPNLQVAQVNAHDWAVTARGFNGASVNTGSVADKLLVMIDGRSVYTPLFGGVFWDAQNVPLEDIDRIEVVSGPGGALWGANAVNGVINVITRSAEQTQGGMVSVAAGSLAGKSGLARYGGPIGRDAFYRVYAERFDGDSRRRVTGADARDDWARKQEGFRADYRPSDANTLTVQGDAYEGREGTPDSVFVNGQNAIARWMHTISPRSDWVAQLYLDRTVRTFTRAPFREELQTADFDFQHRFPLGGRHAIVWGGGYRHMRDDVHNGGSFSFLPAKRTMRLASAFVQDELSAGKALKLTAGVKLEHNDFSGLEAQPSVRLAWTPPGRRMAWGAVSRAVRSPSRFDTELSTRTSVPNPAFEAETVIAYELGYRVRPLDSVSLSLSAFHNRYGAIRSVNLRQTPAPVTVFANDQRATSAGIELSGLFQAAAWWRLRGGYTHLQKSFRTVSPEALAISAPFEAQDPRNQMLLQSTMDLPRGVQVDAVARYVDELPKTLLNPRIAPYVTADVRLAWSVSHWELAVLARNLAGNHPEFSSPILWYEIPRSFVTKVTVTW
ncbi:MAG: TonB-dependent receptor [Acidobacteria bacterium]|nr:TonB-dependent receptor [Acidobacteriota bacterium]